MKTREGILSLLRSLQQERGYLRKEDLMQISSKKDIPLNELYSVASFYAFLSTKPQGKYAIKLCQSLPCYLKGSQEILQVLKQRLKINSGETTEDKKFSVQLVNCIGACDVAPAMLLNGRLYGNLTKEKTAQIINECP